MRVLRTPMVSFVIVAFLAGMGGTAMQAQNFRLTIPTRSELTPVQRLNREGVAAIRKQQYEQAEALFFKAYLFDPADPFTLNNLGYVAEIQGQLDRAQRFYGLASEQGGVALIDRSNSRQLEGKPMREALTALKDVPMRVNRMNVDAISLLSQNENEEADLLLLQALKLDPTNPFTLNNLGVAEEATGDYEGALKYYDAAAASQSQEPIIVTLKASWRGKPVSAMARASADELRDRMQHMDSTRERAAMLAMRGVAATNRNEWNAARQDFMEAYALDPKSAFALNNRGYVAERDGDLETAQFYYQEARRAEDANGKVGVATESSAEGKRLTNVALESNEQVGGKIGESQEARHREGRPIELKRRNDEPAHVASPPPLPATHP